MTNFLRVVRTKYSIRAGLLILFPLLLSSCVSPIIDRIADMEIEAEPMEKPAKGSFSMKVDGKTYSPIAGGVEFENIWYDDEEDGYYGSISVGLNAVDKNHTMVGFAFFVDMNLSSVLNKPIDLSEEFFYYQTGKALNEIVIYFVKEGSITFRKVEEKKFVGEFEVVVYNENRDKEIRITEGKFDLSY